MKDKMSSDGFVRIPTSALSSIRLRHFVSEKDLTISVAGGLTPVGTITGFTEWVGQRQEETLSVGWDWGFIQGSIVLVNPDEIRTNIQLVTHDGVPEQPAIARAHLVEWIESLAWREVIQGLLARED